MGAAGAIAGSVLGFFGAKNAAEGQRDQLRDQQSEVFRQAGEARVRLALRVATERRGVARARGARRAVVGALGSTRRGSVVDVLTDAAAEEERAIQAGIFESEQQIAALERGGELLGREAGRINPFLAGISGAFGGATPFAGSLARRSSILTGGPTPLASSAARSGLITPF